MGEGLEARLRRDTETVLARLSAFDADVDAVVAADRDARIVYANASADRIFGYPRGALLGQNLVVLMPNSHRSRHQRGFSRYLATGESSLFGIPVAMPALSASGSEFRIELLLHAITEGLITVVMARIKPEPQILN